jgi:hypothetical protein
MVPASLEDMRTASPSGGKMVTSTKTMPIATCVAVVHSGSPASHLRPATIQVRAPTTHAEVESIFHKVTMAIRWTWGPHTTCTHNPPMVSCIRAPVPEKHASMTTMLKHFKSNKTPPMKPMPSSLTIAPTM